MKRLCYVVVTTRWISVVAIGRGTPRAFIAKRWKGSTAMSTVEQWCERNGYEIMRN